MMTVIGGCAEVTITPVIEVKSELNQSPTTKNKAASSCLSEVEQLETPIKLACKNIDEATFTYALQEARKYDFTSDAGVIPHHLTAAPMIGGFFQSAALRESSENGEPVNGTNYDTVLLIGPNHTGNTGDVIVSLTSWDFGSGVTCDTEMAEQIQDIKLDTGIIIQNDSRMEKEHSVSALVPFVHHFWPEARVVPVLVSRTLSYGDTLRLADGIANIVAAVEKRVLLICSVDFSHGLTPDEASRNDQETLDAINRLSYREIFAFSNAHVDSPASLIIFLHFITVNGYELRVIDHDDASSFTHTAEQDTTSYFVLTG